VLGVRNYQPNELVRLLPRPVEVSGAPQTLSKIEALSDWGSGTSRNWQSLLPNSAKSDRQDRGHLQAAEANADLDWLLYLFGCEMEWEKNSDTSAAWEVLAAARSSQEGTRAHALSVLDHAQQAEQRYPKGNFTNHQHRRNSTSEAGMRTPYGLEIIESCMGCKASREGFFCRFSTPVLRTTDVVSHHTIMPTGALLFVEGQSPRGIFVICSGKVKLYTTSKEGKVLILKQAEAGEVIGLSAAISDTSYEMTAETASPCQLNFIGRADVMTLLKNESEVGMQAAVWLSREFQGAYRDIHDLVLARSSSGKLARLLLSCAPPPLRDAQEQQLRSAMTHEEMAQRIGSSRETVTRLLSDLKKKRLIRLEGTTLVIRDRSGLEAMAV
jgi:CRP/FNR family transcriptional regulator, cyclic AMP receptor protein